MFLGHILQHLLITQAAADLLPAPPVKSGFVSVYTGHYFYLFPAAWADLKRRLRQSAGRSRRG